MVSTNDRIILALETGIDGANLSILRSARQIGSTKHSGNLNRSEDLLALLEDLLASCSLQKSDIAAIAVSDGPGSLTGIRIGLASAKGLSAALSIPYKKLSVLEAMVLLKPVEGTVVAALYSHGQAVYFKEYVFRRGLMENVSEKIYRAEISEFEGKLTNFQKQGSALVLNKALMKAISPDFGMLHELHNFIYTTEDNFSLLVGQAAELSMRPIMKNQ